MNSTELFQLASTNTLFSLSKNGINWLTYNFPGPQSYYDFTSLAYGNGLIVVLTDRIYVSKDFTNWTATDMYDTSFIAYGKTADGGRFFTQQFGNELITSKDGVTWNTITSSLVFPVKSYVISEKGVSLGGRTGHISSSRNMKNWEQIATITENDFIWITASPSRVFAATSSTLYWANTDDLYTWNSKPLSIKFIS